MGKKFIESILGKRIEEVSRRAKILVFQFDDGTAIVGHLKMTGKFLFVPKNYVRQKHDRILFVFSGGAEHLVWSDIRTFGYLKCVSVEGLDEALCKYGPEPLETSVELLADRLCTPSSRTIKAALLNQECIAGVGNIYADEACHRAGIRPTRRLSSLTAKNRTEVIKEVKKILQKSIDLNGTTSNDYVDTNGTQGGFSVLLKVYGRANLPCLKCKTPIKKIVLVGRGTHYCPTCQR